jgi:hypothetical protein
MESDFNPKAQAPTSSASGLFQFIGQTWLGTVKEAGSQLGYGQYADAISKSSSGDYSVSDPAKKTAIMNLRDDPVASSAMAGVLTQSNSFKLTGAIGRRPTDSELYMAHFMGVNGAAKLITSAEDTPQASGAAMFPNAAAANRSIFYDSGGSARSVSQVYSVLTQRYASASTSSATQSAMAAVGGASATTAAAGAAQVQVPTDTATFLSAFPNANSAASVNMASASADGSVAGDTSFRSLFQGGERSQPVSPAIHKLWGDMASLTSDAVTSAAPAAQTSATPASTDQSSTAQASTQASTSETSSQAASSSAQQGLDLFSDRSGAFSS